MKLNTTLFTLPQRISQRLLQPGRGTRSPMLLTLAGASLLILTSGGNLWAAGDPAAGRVAWTAQHARTDGSPARSCASCHTADLTQAGQHAKTGKVIEPLAPSVNPERLTDPQKVDKWLFRNCRWTLGRACTAAETADFLAYIRSQ